MDLNRIGTVSPAIMVAAKAFRRQRQQGRFVRGPLPWDWLVAAGSLPGKGLQVAVSIWLQVGMKGVDEVLISMSMIAREFNIDRATAGRALAALEQRGLVEVRRRPGAKALVRVIRDLAHAAG